MIETQNIFVGKLAFGLAQNDFIIIANNEEDALHTISENYSDFEVLYLLSLDYLLKVYEKIKEKEDFLFINIDYQNESIVLKDIILKKEEVEKYKDKEGVLLNAEEVFLLVNDVLDNINNKKFFTLVSSNFN